jgi:deoxyribodipyrimidine photo-lyase
VNVKEPDDLPDVFTSYRKSVEPLRERPRPALVRPEKGTLPPMPDPGVLPAQSAPFEIPASYGDLEEGILSPLTGILPDPPKYPEPTVSAHPFKGGEDTALSRLDHLIISGGMTNYQSTRNGLLGTDFSTKLSAYLALGCLTARQIHAELAKFEDGTEKRFEAASGYGQGENEGTKAVRFELLWRDYMRLCTKKFKHKLFRASGFRKDDKYKWKSASKDVASSDQQPGPEEVGKLLQRVLDGTTGLGLIDASQRELFHTGYTSNRARQNVASFLTKHLGIDWRYGAEWYEMLLVDYDVSSNWSNWQYVAGVGNDPRGEARIFNPVKQAFDYDKEGEYVKAWVPEVRKLERLENVFQAWTTPEDDRHRLDVAELSMVTDPVKRIEFSVEGKPRSSRRPFVRNRGHSRGNSRRGGNGGSGGSAVPSDSGGQGPASSESPPSSTDNRGQLDGPRGPAGRGHRNNDGGQRGGYRGRGGGYRGRGSNYGGGGAGGGAYGSQYNDGFGAYGGGYNAGRSGSNARVYYQPTGFRPQWTTTAPGTGTRMPM